MLYREGNKNRTGSATVVRGGRGLAMHWRFRDRQTDSASGRPGSTRLLGKHTPRAGAPAQKMPVRSKKPVVASTGLLVAWLLGRMPSRRVSDKKASVEHRSLENPPLLFGPSLCAFLSS